MNDIRTHPGLAHLRQSWEADREAFALAIGDTLLTLSESPEGIWRGMRYFLIGDELVASGDYDSRSGAKPAATAFERGVAWLITTAQEIIDERIR